MGLVQVLCLAVVFLGCRFGCQTPGQIRRLFGHALLGLGLTAGYALAQMLGLDPLVWIDLSLFHDRLRPAGAAGHTNTLAGLIVMGLPLLVGLFAATFNEPTSWPTARRLALVGLAGIGLLLLIATLSRACWLAALVVGLFLLVTWPWRNRGNLRTAIVTGLLLLGATILVTGWAYPPLRETICFRIATLFEASSRFEIWKTALRIFSATPFFGCGLDTFGLAFPFHRGPEYWQLEWGVLPDQAHNELLHTLATQGLVGVLAYLGLRMMILWTALRAWQASPEQRSLIVVLLGCILGYEVQHLFGFATCVTAIPFACCLGWLARLGAAPGDDTDADPSDRWGEFACLLAGVGILVGNFVLCSERAFSDLLAPVALITSLGMLALVAVGGFEKKITAGVKLYQGKIAAAVAALVLALGFSLGMIDPVLANWYAFRAEACAELNPTLAIPYGDEAIRLAPTHALIFSSRAKCLHQIAITASRAEEQKVLFRNALDASEEACHLEPLCPLYHANHGRILGDAARLGFARPDDVFAPFDRALLRDPCNTLCLADAARAAVALGCTELAQKYLERGLALDADLAALHAEMGSIALIRKQFAQADAHLTRSMSADWHQDVERQGKARALLALAKLELGDVQSALALIRQALRESPELVSGHWLYASILERVGEPRAALLEYQFVLTHQRDHAAALQAVRRLGGS